MNTWQSIIHLLRWELKTEWRNRSALGSVLLYVVCTTVVVYFAVREFSPMTFNALYWVVLFFGATVASGRSFLREGGRRHYYFYTLASPEALLASKLLYNILTIWLVSVITWLLLAFFAGRNFVFEPGYFVVSLLLGGLGLGAILTFVAALAARAGGSGTLMAVLSFPLVIPLLYLLVNAGGYAVGLTSGEENSYLLLALAIDLLSLAVGLVLFPFVWRD
ncbi:heme exporter protein CcmB [Neolewinella lacunae]|uniref:Heme exporter protein CcmB n=1 Tax=Neolewinella lacunae TaxID=1517758 RepID=A0A923PFU1_9BACT|nr:heme exporter protein CcmB [Neolewinella lacunae]MBC6993287.1 heme exporter protein CcmB [Neolewinella lacunae]MDN3635666.1 heme exporter protein CcmB [Neolewinella lacunae]